MTSRSSRNVILKLSYQFDVRAVNKSAEKNIANHHKAIVRNWNWIFLRSFRSSFFLVLRNWFIFSNCSLKKHRRISWENMLLFGSFRLLLMLLLFPSGGRVGKWRKIDNVHNARETFPAKFFGWKRRTNWAHSSLACDCDSCVQRAKNRDRLKAVELWMEEWTCDVIEFSGMFEQS